MEKSFHQYRKSYQKYQLLEDEIPGDPFNLFQVWLQETEASREVDEVNVMNVSTMGLDGFPKSRIVLLKEYDQDGFVFYTNYFSEKGKSLAENPKVCLSFFWPKSERQIIIKGIAKKTSEEDSLFYFKSRPRGSQLGAWASEQSTVISSREVLETSLQELEVAYNNKPIPKPPHWGGYKVFPKEFEFWQGRPNRLHDRILYRKNEALKWKIERLAP